MVYQSKNYSNSTVRNNLRYSYKLQFFGHEEGRVRAIRATPKSNLNTLVYDYMLKDHLGNVRMVLTEEQMETTLYTPLTFQGSPGSAESNNQNQVWENANGQSININGVNITSPMQLQTGSLFPVPLDSSMLVRSSTGKVGAGKLIKVMAGDRIHTSVQYYYPTVGPQPVATGLSTLLGGLGSVISNSAGAGGLLKTASSTLAQGVGVDPLAISFFTNQNSSSLPDKPKAYLNVLFFDEQFNIVASASKYQQVGTGFMNPNSPGQIGFMAGSAALAQKSGYCYIYISNESDDLVYFDNFTLSHERSSLIEETHYYPFGLTMAGISSKAAGKLENRTKYNGIEFDEDMDIDSYEAFYRNLDPQTGRWWQIDPKCEPNKDPNEIGLESLSPYNSMANNPVKLSDPLGDWPDFVSLGQTLLGFANAYASDNTFGVGLVDGNTQSSDFRLGQTLGHVAAVITGVQEVGLAGGAEIASVGFATPAAVPVAAHGATTAAIATKRLVSTNVNSSGTSNNSTNTTQSSSRPATKQEAQKVKEISGGQNRVVLGTPKKKIIYDLNPTGKDHFGVPTPHKMFYKKNFVDGELKSVSRESNKATAVTVADLRMIRKYLESLKK